MICAAIALGLNLATYHADRSRDYQEINPGIYANCDGWTAGAYYNSERNISVHVGYTFSFGPLDVTVGAVSGYRRASIFPVALPSIRFKNVRIAFIPPFEKQSGGVSAAVEWDL